MFKRIPNHRLYRSRERITEIKKWDGLPKTTLNQTVPTMDDCDIVQWIVHQDEKKLNQEHILEQFHVWLKLFNGEFISRHCFNRCCTLAQFRKWLERNREPVNFAMEPYLVDFWDYHVDFSMTYLSVDSSSTSCGAGGAGGAGGGGGAAAGSTGGSTR